MNAMPVKVKRGLGLLVVMVIGYLIVSLGRSTVDDSVVIGGLIEMVGWLTVAVGLIGGPVLIAWGLLRESGRSSPESRPTR